MQMIRFALLAMATACLSVPALAQSTAPIRQGVTTQDVAQQNQQLQQANAELRVRISDMQSEINELNGQVETLQFLLGQTRDEINRMQGDDREIGRTLSEIQDQFETLDRRITSLNERIANLGTQSAGLSNEPGTRTITVRNADGTITRRVVSEGSAPQGGATASGSETAAPAEPEQGAATSAGEATNPPQPEGGYLGTISASDLPGESGALFSEAKSRLLQFDYAGAEVAFRAFLDAFGDDPQAGEALYWLGEVLYQQEQYVDSGAAYTQMIQTYPQDPRAPDALVKLARSMREVGETERACNALDALPRSYPNASSVTLSLAAVERTRAGCDG